MLASAWRALLPDDHSRMTPTTTSESSGRWAVAAPIIAMFAERAAPASLASRLASTSSQRGSARSAAYSDSSSG